MASATSLPATKRAEVRWPMRERSAIPRRERLSESAIKAALSTVHRIFADWNCQRRSFNSARHYSIFYHKRRWVAVRLIIHCSFYLASVTKLFDSRPILKARPPHWHHLRKPLTSGIILVCLYLAGLFRAKDTEVCVNDPTGALWCAQTTVLSCRSD